MVIKHYYSLRKLNTFGLDVNAEKFAEFHSEADLQSLLNAGIRPIRILGGGSNLLLTENLTGLIIKNEIKGIKIIAETEGEIIVSIGGGEVWHELVLWALENNYGGLENLSLIPGSVGAAPIQNIGAYGVELKDIFQRLEAVSVDSGKIKTFDKEACQFGYRMSIFKNELKGKYVITRVHLRLTKKHEINIEYGAIRNILTSKKIINPTIQDVSEAVIEIRQSKLPDPEEIGNSGSFFKNPVISKGQFQRLEKENPEVVYYKLENDQYKIPAGWLIEKAGWKGKRMGGAGCHEKQALVLVNHGNATGTEIRNLANKIQYDVMEKFGVGLIPEVNIW
ncbi:MAG: UDP-N-acetylmuramate dehydrogenase [Bacteroidota bacterium]